MILRSPVSGKVECGFSGGGPRGCGALALRPQFVACCSRNKAKSAAVTPTRLPASIANELTIIVAARPVLRRNGYSGVKHALTPRSDRAGVFHRAISLAARVPTLQSRG